jgi:hypothetical protein
MKLWLVEKLGYYRAAVGTEIGTCLVFENPVASWTRGAWMILAGARGSNALERVS